MKSINRNLLLIVALSFGLSSCLLHKKYTRSDMSLPDKYRNTISVTADTVQLTWRVFYKDPQLVGLIESALDKNNEVAIALKNMAQLDLAFKQAKQSILPTLDLNAGANRSWLSENTLNGSLSKEFIGTTYMDDFNATLRLSWELDIWGKSRMQKEAAKANYFAQKENLSALKTRIIYQVAQAYFNLISLDEQLKIAQMNIALSDSTLRMMQLQFNAGQINSLALNQVEAQKKTAELIVPLALQNISVQENALSILCGNYPDRIVRKGVLDSEMPEVLFFSGVPAQLLSRRPDVKAAEYAVVSANAKTGLAKVAMYPSFSITPQLGANSLNFNNWFNLPGSLTKTLAINLTQPLFQRRALRTAHGTAALEQEKTVLHFKQSLMVAVGEVSDAMAKYEGANQRLKLVDEKGHSLDRANSDVMKLYASGMATYLEVIVAQNNRLQNELDAVSIRLELLDAISNLYRALGGGVE